jgi:hypothetical protein
MLFVDTRQPMTFPLVIPNTHFSRFSLSLASRMFAKVSAKSETILILFADNDYVIDIGEDIFADLIFQRRLRHSAGSRSCIMEALQHSEIAIGSKHGDKVGLFFIFCAKPDLMIPKETL